MSEGDPSESKREIEFEHAYGEVGSETRLVSIPINGMILGDREEIPTVFESFSDLNITYGYEVKEKLAVIADQDDIDGVILEINSPGGTIYGTKAITDGVEAYKNATGKPVIAFVKSVAASGGYWVAASADEIIADTGTSIGSIGIITGPFKYYDGVISEDGGILVGGITTLNGIQTEYLTEGKYKDIGNPYRPLSDEERQVLQQSLRNSYEDFVSFVAKKRGIEPGIIQNQIGALIYSDKQSVELALVDASGNKHDAYIRLAGLAEAEQNKFEVVKEKAQPTFVDVLLSTEGVIPKLTSEFPDRCGAAQPFLSGKPLVFHGSLADFCL